MRLDLISYTEDWFHVMVDKVDVAGAFKRHEELATAELRTTAAHTNSIVRKVSAATSRIEIIVQEGEDLVHMSYRELTACRSAQGPGSLR